MTDEIVKPFRALRPRPDTAAGVVAPPYDVVSFAEAAELAAGRPDSFLRISRPEIELPAGTEPHADAVYARGAANLKRLADAGILVRDDRDGFYVYRMTMGAHTQTGIGLVASVRAYDEHRVRKHERTRPDKEDDRVRNITALNAQTGPVLTVYRADPDLRALLAEETRRTPLLDVEGPHGVRHTIFGVFAAERVAAIAGALNAKGALYIADGHHRSAAAARVARLPGRPASAGYFLSVAYPHDEMRILDYNRVVAGLNALSAADLLARIAERFDVAPLERPARPDRPNRYAMYLDRRWYRLSLGAGAPDDPVERLDVSLLQDRILEPLLGIDDPRTNPRIDFVGGIRGLEGLAARVDAGDADVAFALYPTSMEQLMAVADAGRLMPPKSTWFEPKLADGLLTHVLD